MNKKTVGITTAMIEDIITSSESHFDEMTSDGLFDDLKDSLSINPMSCPSAYGSELLNYMFSTCIFAFTASEEWFSLESSLS